MTLAPGRASGEEELVSRKRRGSRTAAPDPRGICYSLLPEQPWGSRICSRKCKPFRNKSNEQRRKFGSGQTEPAHGIDETVERRAQRDQMVSISSQETEFVLRHPGLSSDMSSIAIFERKSPRL